MKPSLKQIATATLLMVSAASSNAFADTYYPVGNYPQSACVLEETTHSRDLNLSWEGGFAFGWFYNCLADNGMIVLGHTYATAPAGPIGPQNLPDAQAWCEGLCAKGVASNGN